MRKRFLVGLVLLASLLVFGCIDYSEYRGIPSDNPCLNLTDSIGRDTCFFQQAVENRNVRYCSVLKDYARSWRCAEELALITKDPLVCEYIVDDSSGLKNHCIATTAVELRNESFCDIINSRMFFDFSQERDECVAQVAAISKNASVCEAINNASFKQTCLERVST